MLNGCQRFQDIQLDGKLECELQQLCSGNIKLRSISFDKLDDDIMLYILYVNVLVCYHGTAMLKHDTNPFFNEIMDMLYVKSVMNYVKIKRYIVCVELIIK